MWPVVNYKHNEHFCKAFGMQLRKICLERDLSMDFRNGTGMILFAIQLIIPAQ
jgi:hypothetical protein